MRHARKRVVSAVCALALCATLLPAQVLAAGEDAAPPAIVQTIGQDTATVDEMPAPTPSTEPAQSPEPTPESTATPAENPEPAPSEQPEESPVPMSDDAAVSLPAEEDGENTSPDSEPSTQEVVEGEGFTWDEETLTLTITASTGDYTTSSYSERPYQTYASKATGIVVDGDENLVIGSYAFYNFTALKSVEIKTCGEIKDHAFNNCFNLATVTIGTCGAIGDRAFGACSHLANITIGTCGDLGPYVFQNASALTSFTVTGSCGNIDGDTFTQANNLETVSIAKCGDIGASAFSGKSKLSAVTLGECGNIGDSAFYRCAALNDLSTLNCGDIGNTAFSGCTALQTVTVESCGNIGKDAFSKSGLETVTIEQCGDIGSYAFSDSLNAFGGGPLTTVIIGQCGMIGSSAFAGMDNLERVSIDSCQSIKGQAFIFTSGLQYLYIGHCDSIEESAFQASGAPIKELTLSDCTLAELSFYMVDIDTLILKDIVSLGSNAFQSSTIANLTLSNIKEIGSDVFAGCEGLTNLTIQGLDKIGDGMFEVYDETLGNSVTNITLENVQEVGAYAFKNFKELETVTLDDSCEIIGAHAFSGCPNLKNINTISEHTKLGYSDSFVNQPYIHDRVQKILSDKFALIDTTPAIEQIAPEGWTSVQTGKNNRTETVGDTQITKEAKWSNTEKTVADVLLKAYYSVNQQMDFIFVADCSNSMSGFGSEDAMNSNFYNMQSKLMDITNKLLSSEDLDTRVAFTTFGEDQSSVSPFFEKGRTEDASDYIWNDIVNYYSNTNYSHGLEEALALVQQNKAAGRNTTVIFVSDGQPYYDGSTVPEDYYGVEEANEIRAEGVQIISVLQQVPEGSLASSQANMEKISDQVFSSTDLNGFSEAMNDAIDYAYTSYTLTDTIDPAFTLDESSLNPSTGEVTLGQDENGNTTITWTIQNAPYTVHTLNFQLQLKKDANGAYPTGDFDTNEGDATLSASGVVVNGVATPVLPREGSEPAQPEDPGHSEDKPAPTPNPVLEDTSDITPDTVTPAAAPTATAVPQTSDDMPLEALTVVATAAAAAFVVLAVRKRRHDKD